MSHPLMKPIPAKPAEITLDTLPALFAHNRARFGGWTMTQGAPEPKPEDGPTPPERPEGVSEIEWTSLGDTGKTALTRERDARQAAERALASARARPAPPKPNDKPADKTDPPKPEPKEGDKPDFAALIKQAVDAAMKPFADAEDGRRAQAAAEKVQSVVLDAAKVRLHDATDALAGIDLTSVVNEQGVADAEKVKTALDDLVTRKPHLAKVGTDRQAPPGIGGGAPANATDAEKVKAVLSDMQRATGVRIPAAPSGTTN